MAPKFAKAALKDIDRGFADLKKVWKELSAGTSLKVGLLGDESPKNDREDGLTNLEIGTIHEFGIPGFIPERSFLRSSFDKNEEKYQGLLKAGMKNVALGKVPAKTVFEALGMKIVSDVKNGITQGSGIPPPLAPETIARKGSSRPLVDTGQLVASISYVVTTGKAKKE